MKRLLLLLPLLLAAASGRAQAPRLDGAVRAYVASFASADAFSGVALVMRGDTVLAQVAAGEAASGRPNTPSTRFRIASITKPFTSAAVLRLVAEGRLQLNASACQYVRPCPEAWQPVTVRHLLSHTAGIPEYTALGNYAELMARPTTPEALTARFSALPLEFTPGERHAYSNSGYAVLGRVIEAITGLPYADAVRALVLEPLGVPGVRYRDAAGDALGHRPGGTGRVLASAIDLSVAYAAGGLVAKASEVAAFARGFFSDGFLPDSLRTAALTPVHNRYGLGWRTGSHGPGQAAWHGGAIDGFMTYLAYRPESGVTVVVLVNQEAAPVQRMARDLVRMAEGQLVPPPPHSVSLAEADLASVVGTYRVEEGFEFVVRRAAGGGIEMQATGQRPAPLYAQQRDAFFALVTDAQFAFQRDAAGNVVRLVLRQGGQEIAAPRV